MNKTIKSTFTSLFPSLRGGKIATFGWVTARNVPNSLMHFNAEKYDPEKNNKAKVAAEQEMDNDDNESVPAAKVVEEESENHEEEGKDDGVNAMVVEDKGDNEQA